MFITYTKWISINTNIRESNITLAIKTPWFGLPDHQPERMRPFLAGYSSI